MSATIDLDGVDRWVQGNDLPVLESARQEMLENILNAYCF